MSRPQKADPSRRQFLATTASAVAAATMRVSALSAVLDTRYAGVPSPISPN